MELKPTEEHGSSEGVIINRSLASFSNHELRSSLIFGGKLEDQTKIKNLINHMLTADLVKTSKSAKCSIYATEDQIKEVEKHINKFPLCESHHFNDLRSGKWLPMGLTMQIVYDLYKTEVLNPVSIHVYQEILDQRGLTFEPELLGKCEICYYTAHYGKRYPNKRNLITNLRSTHLDDFEEANISKSQDFNSSHLICTFGFHQSLPTPSLSNPKAFYTRPLWTYNFVVEQLFKQTETSKDVNFYMWNEAVGKKEENEMASCLYQYLLELPRHIKTVVFYSSSCNGKSRSKTIAMMFTYLIQNHETLECIDHKFLVDGHSVIEDNTENNWTAKIMRKYVGRINQPKDWYDAFTSTEFQGSSSNIHSKVVVMTPEMFYDFESLGNVFKGHTHYIDDRIKWLRFTREGIYYKNTLSRTHDFDIVDEKLHPQFKKGLGKLDITPMSIERKKDLLDLVKLMPPVLLEVKKFYAALLTQEKVSDPSSTKRKLKEIVQEKKDTLSKQLCIVKEEVDLEDCDIQSLIEKDEPLKKMSKKIDEIEYIDFEQVSVKEENIEESPKK